MVTRKTAAAKAPTTTATRRATGKTAAGAAKAVKAPLAKVDGKLPAATPVARKRATAGTTGTAVKTTATQQPAVARKAASAPKPARKAPASKTPAAKTGARTAAGKDRADAATTRRVVAKRDGETRIVTPEIERIEADAVELAVTGVVPLPAAPASSRPDYWDQACADLMRRDRILKKLIPQFGPAHLAGRGDPFVTLARSIVGQQISVKAAQAVWDRVQAICPKLTPAQFIKAGHDALAGCGLSRRKAEYILDLATHFKSGALHVDAWATMDDEAVIAELTGIRGIGRWTAEMFLMFNLLRPDVLPLDDVGLINAISVNYFSGEPVTRSEAREVAANWEPWRSVATWYMWRSLEPVPVEY